MTYKLLGGMRVLAVREPRKMLRACRVERIAFVKNQNDPMRRGNGQTLLRGTYLTISISDDISDGRQKDLFACLLKALVERDYELFTVGTREGEKNVIRAGLFRVWPRVSSTLVNYFS